MEIQHFFDPATSTLSYVVHDGKTGVVVDPVLDYNRKSGLSEDPVEHVLTRWQRYSLITKEFCLFVRDAVKKIARPSRT